jgi:hypothetical protein
MSYEVNNMMIYLNLYKKWEQANPKSNEQKEITKISADKINKYNESMKQKADSLRKKKKQGCQTSSQSN